MPPRDEAGVSHIHVDVATGTVPADDDPILLDQVLEIAALDAGYRVPLVVRAPLHSRGARGLRLQREKGPRIAFRRHRVRGHNQITHFTALFSGTHFRKVHCLLTNRCINVGLVGVTCAAPMCLSG